jgi:hypothetical protein
MRASVVGFAMSLAVTLWTTSNVDAWPWDSNDGSASIGASPVVDLGQLKMFPNRYAGQTVELQNVEYLQKIERQFDQFTFHVSSPKSGPLILMLKEAAEDGGLAMVTSPAIAQRLLGSELGGLSSRAPWFPVNLTCRVEQIQVNGKLVWVANVKEFQFLGPDGRVALTIDDNATSDNRPAPPAETNLTDPDPSLKDHPTNADLAIGYARENLLKSWALFPSGNTGNRCLFTKVVSQPNPFTQVLVLGEASPETGFSQLAGPITYICERLQVPASEAQDGIVESYQITWFTPSSRYWTSSSHSWSTEQTSSGFDRGRLRFLDTTVRFDVNRKWYLNESFHFGWQGTMMRPNPNEIPAG